MDIRENFNHFESVPKSSCDVSLEKGTLAGQVEAKCSGGPVCIISQSLFVGGHFLSAVHEDRCVKT